MDEHYKEILEIFSIWKENTNYGKLERVNVLLTQFPFLRRLASNQLMRENFRLVYTSHFDGLAKLLLSVLQCSYHHDSREHRIPLYNKMITELPFLTLRHYFNSPLIHYFFKLELFHCLLIQQNLNDDLDFEIVCKEICASLIDKKTTSDFNPQRNHILQLNKILLEQINKEQNKAISAQNIMSLTSLSQLLVTEESSHELTEVTLPELEFEVLLNVLNILQEDHTYKEFFYEMSLKNSGKILLWDQFFFVLVNTGDLYSSSKILYKVSTFYDSQKVLRKLVSEYRCCDVLSGKSVKEVPLYVLPRDATLQLIVLFQLEIVENLDLKQENMNDTLDQALEVAEQLSNPEFSKFSHFFLEKNFVKKRNVTVSERTVPELYIESIVEKLLSRLDIAQGVTILSYLSTKSDNFIVVQFLEYYLCEYFYFCSVKSETNPKYWREICAVLCSGLNYSVAVQVLIKCVYQVFCSFKTESLPILNPLMFNSRKIEFLYVFMAELQRVKSHSFSINHIITIVASQGISHFLFDFASWLHYKSSHTNKEIEFSYQNWLENLLKTHQSSVIFRFLEERCLYEYSLVTGTLKNIKEPNDFQDLIQEVLGKVANVENWKMIVPSSISPETISFYTDNPLYVNLIHLFTTSREDLFHFISELNSNEAGRDIWKLFIENVVKFPLPHNQEKLTHVVFINTLIYKKIPFYELLSSCVTPFSSALLTNVTKFFPTISTNLETFPLSQASMRDFSPLRFEMVINEYIQNFPLPDLNLLTLVLLEFALQSYSKKFLESCKALILLFQDWIVIDVIENRFKKLLWESMEVSQKKCNLYAILQIMLLLEQRIDWNLVFSFEICSSIQISDVSSIETQTIAWLLDSVTSVSNAYTLLQRIVFLVTRSNSIQSKNETVNKKYWSSLVENHTSKDIILSKLCASTNNYILVKDSIVIPPNTVSGEYLQYRSSIGDSDMLLCPTFSRWLAWELLAKCPCDMQYYFVLIDYVFLPFQYKKNSALLVNDFFLELLNFIQKENLSIHFEIVVLFQYFAQQCEDVYWLFDILVSCQLKEFCYKIVSYIPFQQLIPAADISVLAMSLQKIGGVFQWEEYQTVPFLQCFLKAFAFLISEENTDFISIVNEFLTQLFEQMPAVKSIFSEIWTEEFKEFLILSGLDSSISVLQNLIPSVPKKIEKFSTPTNFIDQFMANPQAFDALRMTSLPVIPQSNFSMDATLTSPKKTVQTTLTTSLFFSKRALSAESSETVLPQNRKRVKLIEEAPKVPSIKQVPEKQLKQQKFNNKVSPPKKSKNVEKKQKKSSKSKE